jgi:hypothetical protein
MCSHCLFPARWHVVNGLLTTCVVVELNSLVTSCSNNFLPSCNSTICQQVLSDNLVASWWNNSIVTTCWQACHKSVANTSCWQVVSFLRVSDTGHDSVLINIIFLREYIPVDPKELANRIFVTCYMGSENSSEDTRSRAKNLAQDVGSYHMGKISLMK